MLHWDYVHAILSVLIAKTRKWENKTSLPLDPHHPNSYICYGVTGSGSDPNIFCNVHTIKIINFTELFQYRYLGKSWSLPFYTVMIVNLFLLTISCFLNSYNYLRGSIFSSHDFLRTFGDSFMKWPNKVLTSSLLPASMWIFKKWILILFPRQIVGSKEGVHIQTGIMTGQRVKCSFTMPSIHM